MTPRTPMTRITMDARGITRHLTPLLITLAEVIEWLCHQKGKITFDVTYTVATNPRDGGCVKRLPEFGRTDAEIFLGVLKTMRARSRRRRTSEERT